MSDQNAGKNALTTGAASRRALMEAKTGKKFVPGERGKLSVGLAKNIKTGAGRAVIALDCSGSMGGSCIVEAKKGARAFVTTALGRGYKVGIVAFGTTVTRVADMSDDAGLLTRAIDGIELSETTDMAGGLNEAIAMLQGAGEGGTIFVVTDGIPNNEDDANRAGNRAKAMAIDIMCQGTEQADHTYLKSLASSDELAQMAKPADLQKSMKAMASKYLALSHEGKCALPPLRKKK